MEMNDRGETKGRYDAACIETVLVQIKPEGTCDWETKGFELTKDGGVVGFVGKGSGSSSAPGILVGILSLTGETHFMTMVKDLRWLQTTKCRVEMSIDVALGEFRRKVYAKK